MLAVILAVALSSPTPPSPTLAPAPASAPPAARFRTLEVGAARDTAPAAGAPRASLPVSAYG